MGKIKETKEGWNMDIFDFLTMLGGLSLFLFGMSLMGSALERRAGSRLRSLLDQMTGKPLVGFLTGLGVTAIIQSSSATTVMVVGFVNSGLMTLRQAINVIMGANVGTTVTAWLLSLGGIESSSVWLRLLKPSSFTPVLALIGIVFYMFCKDAKKKDTGTILLGFATLMFGMETMSGAVSGLSQVPAFTNLFLAFRNPILGVLVGAVLTGIIQSSSASVGILQALSATGAVSYAAAIPIIMGQNIGTTVTAMLSSVGTNKNARRAAVVHLLFNLIGVAVLLSVFCIVRAVLAPALLDESATRAGIAVAHSVFNLLCTAMLLPAGDLLEKLAIRLVPDSKSAETVSELDERLLAAPSLALSRSRAVACEMAQCAVRALNNALRSFTEYTDTLARSIRDDEERCDHYEDILGTYLVQLSARKMGVDESEEATELLKSIGDFERISDHAVNILESAEELRGKSLAFSAAAAREYDVLAAAIGEILDLSLRAFERQDVAIAELVEPLEQVIDTLKEQMRTRHILRMQQGHCSIEAGFVWSDLLTNLERTSDHCSNMSATPPNTPCPLPQAHSKVQGGPPPPGSVLPFFVSTAAALERLPDVALQQPAQSVDVVVHVGLHAAAQPVGGHTGERRGVKLRERLNVLLGGAQALGLSAHIGEHGGVGDLMIVMLQNVPVAGVEQVVHRPLVLRHEGGRLAERLLPRGIAAQLFHEKLRLRLEDLLHQRVNVRVVVIERVAVHRAALGDILHGDLVERALVEQLNERLPDRLLGAYCHVTPPFPCASHTMSPPRAAAGPAPRLPRSANIPRAAGSPRKRCVPPRRAAPAPAAPPPAFSATSAPSVSGARRSASRRPTKQTAAKRSPRRDGRAARQAARPPLSQRLYSAPK